MTIEQTTSLAETLPEPQGADSQAAAQASEPTMEQGTAPRRKKLPKQVTVGLRIGFSLVLFAVIFRAVSWQAVLGALAHASLGMVLLGFLVGVCGVLVSCLQWGALLAADGIHLPLLRLVKFYLIGIAFNHFLPTGMGGDAVKALYVGRDSGNPAASASAVVMTRVTGFLGMLLVAAPAVILLPGARWQVALVFAGLTVLVGGMIGGAFYAATSMDRLSGTRFGENWVVKKAVKFARALRSSAKPQTVWLTTAYGMYFWLTGCLNYAVFGAALGVSVPLYFYFVAIPLSSLVTFLPISLGGYGVREGALTFAFTAAMVAAPTALTMALLVDMQSLLFAIVGGFLYFPMTRRATVIPAGAAAQIAG